MNGVTIRWCSKCEKHTVHYQNTEDTNDLTLHCREHQKI